MIYLIIVLLILFGVYKYDYCQREGGKLMFLFIICLFLILIAGLRYRLGQDTLGYLKDYESLKPITDLQVKDFAKTRFAPGFVVITSIFKQFTNDFTYFQLFQAAVVNIVVFYFFNKYSRHVFFAILIYFFYQYFVFCFQQLREALAVCVFLMSWPFYVRGKWLYWYMASFLAFSFHISAIIMFLVPLICLPGVKQLFIFGRRTWFICLIIAVGAYGIQIVFFKYIEILAFTESMVERAQTYGKNVMGGMTLNLGGGVALLFRYILYPVIVMYFLSKSNTIRKKFEFDHLNSFVLMSVYVSIASFFISILLRYNNYFFPFVTLLISDWVFGYIKIGIKKVRLNLLYWVIFFIPMFGFQTYGYFSNINRSGTLKIYMVYYPYRSILDKTENEQTEKAIIYMHRHV